MEFSLMNLLHYGSIYLIMGIIIGNLIDYNLKRMYEPTEFTLSEMIITIVLWPLVIIVSIFQLINDKDV